VGAVTLLSLLCVQDAPEPDRGYGPFKLSSLSPFQSLRPGFIPRTPSAVTEGQVEVRAASSWVNIWAFNEDDYLLDYEILHSQASLAWGAAHRVNLEFEIENNSRFGGVMDPLIDNFHDAVGADQRHREDFAENDFQFELQGRDGRPSASLSNRDRGSFARAFMATFQYDVLDGLMGGSGAVSAAATLRFDLGPNEDLRGGLPVDFGLSAGASQRVGDFIFHAAGSVGWFGHEEFHGIVLRALQASGLAGVEWLWHARASFIFQYLLSQGAAEDWLDFSEPSNEITFGCKFRIFSGTILEIAVIENFLIPDNSPDFGMHAGLSVRW
jgi:hypothetical protein